MTLFITSSGGSPIINVSGSNMEFSIDFDGHVANITALGYMVDVSTYNDIANVKWYQFPVTGTVEYGTIWTSQIGLNVEDASPRYVDSYNGTCQLYSSTGMSIVNDLYITSSPSTASWYPNKYYFYPGGYYKWFMGYTFHCPMTGNYSIFANTMYLGITPPSPYFSIDYEATVTIFVAGQSSTPSTDSYSGIFSSKMTTHSGLSVTDVPLVSGTTYSFDFTVDIDVTDVSEGVTSTYHFTLWLCDPDDPPTLWYRITGTSG